MTSKDWSNWYLNLPGIADCILKSRALCTNCRQVIPGIVTALQAKLPSVRFIKWRFELLMMMDHLFEEENETKIYCLYLISGKKFHNVASVVLGDQKRRLALAEAMDGIRHAMRLYIYIRTQTLQYCPSLKSHHIMLSQLSDQSISYKNFIGATA